MKNLHGILLGLVLFSSAGYAFSPYENYLLSGKSTHVGLIARAIPNQEEKLSRLLSNLCDKKDDEKLKQVGISNPAVFKRIIKDDVWFMVYFQYSGKKQYLSAVESFESVTPELNPCILPHPRAAGYGHRWLQMEWINYIRGLNVDREPTKILSMVTTIKPEKESQYRSLHQTVWPGVVDQMIRGNNRNFSIFLVEIGDCLYEFFYLEYMGRDSEKDNQMNQADPVNQRWWAQTGPCQKPLAGEKEIWAPMTQVKSADTPKEPVND